MTRMTIWRFNWKCLSCCN